MTQLMARLIHYQLHTLETQITRPLMRPQSNGHVKNFALSPCLQNWAYTHHKRQNFAYIFVGVYFL